LHLDRSAKKTFKDYGTTGQCDRRYYIHSDEEAVEHNARLNSNLNDRSAISSYCLVLLLLLLLFSLQRGHTCGNCRLQRLMAQCDRRYYIHSDEEAVEHNARLNSNLNPGEFTPWEKVGAGTDLLFYEGLHGAVVADGVNMAQYGDLKIGVVPSVNLEWIQKISRDNAERGYSAEDTVDTILRRMPDYINYITPQFSQTDINFQRIATVDTSNPFITRDIPTPDESLVVIRFKDLNPSQITRVF
jgi:phosphoribulokinase